MKEIFGFLIGAALCLAGAVLYYEGLHLPFFGQVIDGVIAHRLEAVVSLYETKAATARSGEVQRQADAVNAAVAAYQRRLTESQAAETQTKTDTEKRISDYEARLSALQRQCFADDADVDFVVRHH